MISDKRTQMDNDTLSAIGVFHNNTNIRMARIYNWSAIHFPIIIHEKPFFYYSNFTTKAKLIGLVGSGLVIKVRYLLAFTIQISILIGS